MDGRAAPQRARLREELLVADGVAQIWAVWIADLREGQKWAVRGRDNRKFAKVPSALYCRGATGSGADDDSDERRWVERGGGDARRKWAARA